MAPYKSLVRVKNKRATVYFHRHCYMLLQIFYAGRTSEYISENKAWFCIYHCYETLQVSFLLFVLRIPTYFLLLGDVIQGRLGLVSVKGTKRILFTYHWLLNPLTPLLSSGIRKEVCIPPVFKILTWTPPSVGSQMVFLDTGPQKTDWLICIQSIPSDTSDLLTVYVLEQ